MANLSQFVANAATMLEIVLQENIEKANLENPKAKEMNSYEE